MAMVRDVRALARGAELGGFEGERADWRRLVSSLRYS
jgi:hypothetical protein